MAKQRNSSRSTAGKAARNIQQALRSGLSLNEASGRWLRLMLKQADLARDWQKGFERFSLMANGALSGSIKQAGELLELMGHSTRAKSGLMRQALDAANAPTLYGSQAKWMEFWTDALRLAQSNAGRLTEINSRAINSWIRLARNGDGES